MATPRLIRRLAFQALYQLDAVKDAELDRVRASIDIDEDLKPGEVDKALDLASKAFEHRGAADDAGGGGDDTATSAGGGAGISAGMPQSYVAS